VRFDFDSSEARSRKKGKGLAPNKREAFAGIPRLFSSFLRGASSPKSPRSTLKEQDGGEKVKSPAPNSAGLLKAFRSLFEVLVTSSEVPFGLFSTF